MPLINLIYYIQIHILYESEEKKKDREREREEGKNETNTLLFLSALIYCNIYFIFYEVDR